MVLVLLVMIIHKHKPYPGMSNALKDRKGILINSLIFLFN